MDIELVPSFLLVCFFFLFLRFFSRALQLRTGRSRKVSSKLGKKGWKDERRLFSRRLRTIRRKKRAKVRRKLGGKKVGSGGLTGRPLSLVLTPALLAAGSISCLPSTPFFTQFRRIGHLQFWFYHCDKKKERLNGFYRVYIPRIDLSVTLTLIQSQKWPTRKKKGFTNSEMLPISYAWID